MTQGLLYDRRWRLQVGDWLTDSLRVLFEVQRNRDYHPNAATVTVYNTTQETRTAFARNQPVSLFGRKMQMGLLTDKMCSYERMSQGDRQDQNS